jgi:ElaB/YqjD/DUF883 family membrane-anchored ribosome-binding protein
MMPSDRPISAPPNQPPAVVDGAKRAPEVGPGMRPEDIRAQMVLTRAELSDTIDAIQERLDPENLKHQATENIRAATIGKVEQAMNRVEDTVRETRYGLADTIRHNPIPAALVGVGLTWLFFNGSDRRDATSRSYGRYPTNGPSVGMRPYGGLDTPNQPTPEGAASRVQGSAQNLVDQAGSQARRLGQQAQQAGGQAVDQVENLGNQVQDTVQNLGSQAQDTVQHLGSQAIDQVGEIRDDVQGQVQHLTYEVQQQTQWLSTNFDRILRANPLSVGAVALALGAAVGLAAPDTAPEEKLLGGARERVQQKAQEAAHGAMENAQKIVQNSQSTAETSY